MRLGFGALVVVAASTVGCASSVEVTRTVTPSEAVAQASPRFEPVAVVRGGVDVLPIPPNAKVDAARVAWSNEPGEHVHHLEPGDVIVADEQSRIVAVRSAGEPPVFTRFVPGTASSPEGTDYVKGTLENHETVIPLAPGDRIRMRGSFDAEESIPGGGRVATKRSVGALVAGVGMLVLSYVPSAVVGASSSLPADRVLLVPLAGPWIDLLTRPKCDSGTTALPVDPCIGETTSKALLITSGAAQVLGAILLAVGIPSTTSIVYDGDNGTTPAAWTFTPNGSPHGAGFSAARRF